MNKKEISEIKKQFTPDNCAITRICGCYVDGERIKKRKSPMPSSLFPKKRSLNILKFSEKRSPEHRDGT